MRQIQVATRPCPPMRVLLVDDHEISRAVISALLRTEGAEVADIGTGEAAVAVAIAFRPAVAIVDVTPADPSGFVIADRLRALPDGPAVVLTSSAGRRRFTSQLDNYRFVAKADLCVQTLQAGPFRENCAACADTPAHSDSIPAEPGDGRS